MMPLKPKPWLKNPVKALPEAFKALKRVSEAMTHPQKSRYLNEAEIKMAQSVFGPTFDLSQVQLKTAWWVLKNYAVSPNGNIYFNPQDWIEDFSQQPLRTKSWLIHELTHVWQIQQGLKVVRGAMMNRQYDYILEQGKPFFSFGIEQQARMVQDYFERREQGRDCAAWQACIPFLQQSLLQQSQADVNNEKTLDT